MPRLLLLSLALPLLPALAADPLQITLAGDSTVAQHPTDKTQAGWGVALPHFLRPSVQVTNLAKGGASTRSFRTAGYWEKVLATRPDYIFIQFGHNDQPGKGPDRETDPATTYRTELRRFIDEARAIGATPILVTSVARRTFEKNGSLTDTLKPYAEATLAVGKEKAVPVVDLHRTSYLLFSQRGEKFCQLYAPDPKDKTHFSHEGAHIMARLVAEGLNTAVPALAPHLQLLPIPPPNLPFDLTLHTVSKGYDGKTCWVHPRAGAIPGPTPTVVMTAQKLLLTGSDVFYELNDTRTSDLGKTWTPLTPHPDTLGRRTEPDGTIVAACDFTPKWHAASGKLLGVGHTVLYQNDKVVPDRPRSTSYSTYDPATRQWTPWTTLQMPADQPDFFNSGAGCSQRFDLENGDILLPIYCKAKAAPYYSVTVLRCRFDGTTLTYLEHGPPLTLESGRGVYEPSLTRFKDTYYLTLRNDTAAYLATSTDGLNYTPIKPWRFDDGTELGSYNTQAHWVTHHSSLWLAYTRRGAHNDHVVRHRAPLFIAQVDPKTLSLIKKTETILVPERGARLGNFAVTEVSENETWVTVAEWMQTHAPHIIIPPENAFGADNSIYTARLHWKPIP
ncbi:MAG: GDSL-type esterase/lipase family protein [Verrucomicrobiaceae bacterium]|nr:GDSL-type esterase/lipase family protein [Verrucomicrobiaceae bacterium]